MSSKPDLLVVGRVARAHGVKGELRVEPFDPSSETLLGVDEIVVRGVARKVKSARPTNGAVLMMIDGCADRDAAEALKGAEVEVDRAAVPLDDGEFLIADLIGCTVVTPAGVTLGVAAKIIPGPQDLLELHDGALLRLMPLVDELIVEIDLDARRLVVDVPDDLPTEPIR